MPTPLNSTKAAALIEAQTDRRCSRQNLEKLCERGALAGSRCVLQSKPLRLDADLLVSEYLAKVAPYQAEAQQPNQKRTVPSPSRQPKPAPAAAVAVDVEAAAPTDQQLRMFIQGLPEDQIPDLNDSRARYEHYKAEKARLEALQGRGELVTAADVKAEAFACGRAVRDALLGLADRLAPILAATMDARECHRLLTEEHRIALRSLADG